MCTREWLQEHGWCVKPGVCHEGDYGSPGLVKKATTGLCGFHLSEEADLELQELVLLELERVLVNGDERIELL